VDNTTVIATAVSPQGRPVELTQRKWSYIQRHVEMGGELELLLTAIGSPTSKSQTRVPAVSVIGSAHSRHSSFAG
jgi:hypothetical protein